MADANTIDFWLSVGSTYTYLTVSRLHEVSARTGLTFRWRPFAVRTIMAEQGNIPFAGKPIKSAYMWRDIERRAGLYRLPYRGAAPYPLGACDMANRVAVLGAQEGWCADYVRATYRRWFLDGQEAGSEPNLSASLREIGQDPDRVIERAQREATGRALAAATDEARALTIFGSPSFVVRGEVFWGDDRLDDAIRWHRNGTLR